MTHFEGKPVGFIGLGIMGKPMARNLAQAGFDLVIFNRSQDDIETLLAETPTDPDERLSDPGLVSMHLACAQYGGDLLCA